MTQRRYHLESRERSRGGLLRFGEGGRLRLVDRTGQAVSPGPSATPLTPPILRSGIGALNGWTMMCAQIPLAASKGGMFPKQFGALTDRKVPAFGIISSTALASIAVIISYLGTSDATVFTTLVLRGSMTQPTAVPEAQEAAR